MDSRRLAAFTEEHGEGPGTIGTRHYVSRFYHRQGGHSKKPNFYWSETEPGAATHVVVPLGDYVELIAGEQ